MRRLSVCLTVPFFLILLFFPALSMEGASQGLLLWFRKVVPVLLPFALVSHLMVETHLPEALSPRFCVVLMGFVCGYPMGAVWASALSEKGQISPEEGERLLLFCNQPSPMFLIGYLGIQCLHVKHTLPLLACAYLPPLLYGFFLLGKNPSASRRNMISFIPLSVRLFEKAWMDSCRILVKIGGYMMLFSILAAALSAFFTGQQFLKPLIIGFFEMTTGIGLLSECAFTLPLRGAIGLYLACFGGLSTYAQTMGCLSEGPLNGRHYFFAKLFLGLISAILYYILLCFLSCR